jgi:hypothetical protein
MAKRKTVAALPKQELLVPQTGPAPQSYTELRRWCSQRAKELTPVSKAVCDAISKTDHALDKHQKGYVAFRTMLDEFVSDERYYTKSDDDPRPARQFRDEFVSHLKRLGYEEADGFQLEGVALVYANKTLTTPLPPSAKVIIRGDGPQAEWTDEQGKRVGRATKVPKGKNLLAAVVSDLTCTERYVRLGDVRDRARNLCSELAVQFGEYPARWLEGGRSPPDSPVRSFAELLEYLDDHRAAAMQIAGTAEEVRKGGVAHAIVLTTLQRVVWWMAEKHSDVARPALPSDLRCKGFDWLLHELDGFRGIIASEAKKLDPPNDDDATRAAKYMALLASVKTLALRSFAGKQLRVTMLLVESGGRKAIVDLATDKEIDWDHPYKTGVDGYLKHIKPKLAECEASIVVINQEMRIVPLSEARLKRRR